MKKVDSVQQGDCRKSQPRVAKVGGLLTLLGFLVLPAYACLVRSWCLSDEDCDGNEQCELEQGVCFLECQSEAAGLCPHDRPQCRLEENRCVQCLENRHCALSEQCIDGRCFPEEATLFSLVDENPSSSSFGRTISLNDHRGEVVMLFFATLG